MSQNNVPDAKSQPSKIKNEEEKKLSEKENYLRKLEENTRLLEISFKKSLHMEYEPVLWPEFEPIKQRLV